jgi:mono/diheme cytochrome c family protein
MARPACLRNLWFCLPLLMSSVVAADEREDYFETHIRPLLAHKCINCHGATEQSGGLRLDTATGLKQGGDSGPAIQTNRPDASLLIQAVRRNGDLQMPPDDELSDLEISQLTEWIRSGAYWPSSAVQIESGIVTNARSHWAFQPVTRPVVPSPKSTAANGQPAQHPVDAFIQQRLQREGLASSPRADRRTRLRRLSYTLTGLPPDMELVEEFLEDSHPDAWPRLIDQLLSSPAYGEHWARQWLDLARYSDTKGYVYAREERFWVHAWSYRDWVVKSLNDDMPYDRFLLLQIAADQVPDRRETDLAAMGFLTLGRRFLGVQRDIIDDRIDVVTRGTMALTVGCARCHDHKYDPIPTADYYSLYGVFASCRERMVPLASSALPEEYTRELQSRWQKLEETRQQRRQETAARHRARIGDYLQAQFELEKYPDEGFDQVFSTEDLLPSGVRRWERYLRQTRVQRSPVFTVWHAYLDTQNNKANTAVPSGEELAAIPADTNARVAAVFPRLPATRAELIDGYARLFNSIEQEWSTLRQQAEGSSAPPPERLADSAAEEVRQVLYGSGSPCVVPDEPIVHTEYDFDSAACNELWKLQGEVDRWIINADTPPPYAVILEDRDNPVPGRIFKRGNPARKGDEVPRQFLQLLSGPERHPFRTGSGRLELAQAIIHPDNPLTARVIVNRVWAQHFGRGLVATPGDFGTRAATPSHPQLLDWLAVWFVEHDWSLKELHKLLLTSETFQQTSTGPAQPEAVADAIQRDPENHLLWRMNAHRLSFEELRDSLLAACGDLDTAVGGPPVQLLTQPFSNRRTLYGRIDRQFLPGTLRMFDFANPDLLIPERSDTTVPQQALFLMNHPLQLHIASQLVSKLPDAGTTAQHVTSLYETVLQRSPTVAELENACEFLTVTASPQTPLVPETAADWSYGYGHCDETAGRVAGFTALPHFTGTAWQGGPAWPDPTLGWVQLTATGGHPGNDRNHAAVRRWTAPADMTIEVKSKVTQTSAPGDGIRVFIISSADGILDSAVLHQQTVQLDATSRQVSKGDTIDFLCDIGDVLNSDEHEWQIQLTGTATDGTTTTWDSARDFTRTTTAPLSPLEQFAQALLCTNEFYFVD